MLDMTQPYHGLASKTLIESDTSGTTLRNNDIPRHGAFLTLLVFHSHVPSSLTLTKFKSQKKISEWFWHHVHPMVLLLFRDVIDGGGTCDVTLPPLPLDTTL